MSFIILGSVTGMVILYSAFLIIITWPLSEISINKAGVFGDSFGVLTSLFSGLAFSGMIITILLQREDLKLQREDLTETQNEMKEQKNIFRLQNFNNSFYRLLDFYRQNLLDIIIYTEGENSKKTGLDALLYQLKKLQVSYVKYGFQGYPEDENEQLELDYVLFKEINKNLRDQSRYLNTISSIYALIDTQLLTKKEKEIYWDLFSKQLTFYEVKYLFYKCLVLKEGSTLRQYLHESGLFEARATTKGITNTHKTIYQKYYGISLAKKEKSISIPMEKSKLKIAKKLFRKRLKLMNLPNVDSAFKED